MLRPSPNHGTQRLPNDDDDDDDSTVIPFSCAFASQLNLAIFFIGNCFVLC